MAIDFPAWVTNETEIPVAYRVPAKKVLYTFAAAEYARQLHNAGWKWHRGEALTSGEEVMLADAFPGLWPTPPTEAQLRSYLANVWEPRQREIQSTRAAIRTATAHFDLTWIDWGGII